MKKILLTLLLLFNCLTVNAENDINKLAEKYVSKTGDCFYIATLFLRDYYDDQNFKITTDNLISYEEAVPGDVIFYENGGRNTTHWAVYLGNDKALQGNYHVNNAIIGRTIIGDVYLNFKNATLPIFYSQSHKKSFTFDFDFIEL